MAHGKSLLMANIRPPAPEWVHKHKTASMAMRRSGHVPLAAIAQPQCKPYVNPARDLKPGRLLRFELRNLPLCDYDGVVRKGSHAYRGEEYDCPGGAILNGFAVACWSLAHDPVLTPAQVREVTA